MKNREDFLDEAVEKIINRDDLIYIDENGESLRVSALTSALTSF
jgi:hypothetical protein